MELTYREPRGRKHVMTIGSEDAERFAQVVERSCATGKQPPESARIAQGQETELAENRDQEHHDPQREAR